MKRILLSVGALGLFTCMLLFTHALVTAQGNLYELSLSLVGSGSTISGGAYTMALTVGDPKADEVIGGGYNLGAGILGGGARVVAPITPAPATETPVGTPGDATDLFLPLVER